MSSGAYLLTPKCKLPTTVADEIHELLGEFRGIQPLKRLFWELLGYDRREETVVFPASAPFRSSVHEGQLFASHESFHIYYVTLIGDSLDRPLAQRICRYFRWKNRDVAVIFSNVARSRWLIAYLADDPTDKKPHARLCTMALADPDENPRRQARQLARLSTYDANDQPLCVLEILAAFDVALTGIGPASPTGTKVLDEVRYLLHFISRYPLLTRRQEQSIFAELTTEGTLMQEGDLSHEEYALRKIELRERLILHNLRLCFMFAKRYSNDACGIADLFQEAVFGLHRAVEAFDPTYGNRFSTYASYWIKESIRRAKSEMTRTIHVPAYLLQLKRDWSKASPSQEERPEHASTEGAIAAALNLTPKQAGNLKQAIHVDSFTPLSDQQDSHSSLIDQIIDERSLTADETMNKAELNGRIREQLGHLDPREARVLSMRFGLEGPEEMTLREVGETLGLTRERVRQIERLALQRLRRCFGADDPDIN